MHFLEKLERKPDQAIEATIKTVVDDAKSKWNLNWEGEYPEQGIGFSSLRPFHVEGNSLPNAASNNNWQIVITTANTWQNWCNVSLDQNIYIIIAGIFDNTTNPALTEIAFKANGNDLPVQNVEVMFAYESPKLYFSMPFAVSPLNAFVARLYGSAAQTEDAGLIGYAVARRLRLILED